MYFIIWVEFYWKILKRDYFRLYQMLTLLSFRFFFQLLESKSVSHIMYACTKKNCMCYAQPLLNVCAFGVSFACFRLRAFVCVHSVFRLRAFGYSFAVMNLRICAFVFKIIPFRAWKFSFSFSGITKNDVNLAVASTVAFWSKNIRKISILFIRLHCLRKCVQASYSLAYSHGEEFFYWLSFFHATYTRLVYFFKSKHLHV